MPLRALDLVLQALFDIAAIKKACQRIEKRHLVDLLRQRLHFVHRKHLVGKLPPNAADLQLLIDHINIEDQHHAHKPAYCLVQKEGIVGVRARE